jgi:hypothetical protein
MRGSYRGGELRPCGGRTLGQGNQLNKYLAPARVRRLASGVSNHGQIRFLEYAPESREILVSHGTV